MGFFDSVSTALGGGSGLGNIAADAASVIPGVGQMIGSQQTNAANEQINSANNAFNAQQAEINREFQANQSATAVQTRVADLTKAGLNPALAYGQGGASAMSGSQASAASPIAMRNPFEGGGLSASIPMLADAYDKLTSADLNSASADKARAETPGAAMQPQVLAAQIGEINTRSDLNAQQKLNLIAEIPLIQSQIPVNKAEVPLKQNQSGLTNAQTTGQLIQNNLESNKLPLSSNQANYHDSWIGRVLDWFDLGASSAMKASPFGSVIYAPKTFNATRGGNK